MPRASPLDFLPVRVVRTATGRPSTAGPIEIVLPNGRVVRVPVGFDEAEVERVLAVLQRRLPGDPPCGGILIQGAA